MPPTQTTNDALLAAGQRRYLTLLFADLSDSTQLSAAMDAEDYAQLLVNLRESFRTIIAQHGGHIARIQGDGALALFGYPHAEEGDARRATEAALDLHAAIRRLDLGTLPSDLPPTLLPLALHTGIHGGLVYLASGDIERGRFDLVGDVPNIAARLSALARRDEICVSEETLGAEAHFFSTHGHAAETLAGRATPLRVLRITGRLPPMNRFEARAQRGLAPFVGREAILLALQQHVDAALCGEAQSVTLVGGAGIGKTRLIEEIAQQATTRGFRVLRGYCESYQSAEPLQPFIQILRVICQLQSAQSLAETHVRARSVLHNVGVLDADQTILLSALALTPVAPLAPLTSATPSEPSKPATAATVIAALRSLVAALLRKSPVCVIVDDLQWADDASWRMLDQLRELTGPLVLLGGTREAALDVFDPTKTTSIELSPLSLADATRSIERLLPEADPFMVADIHRYAGGNPLFIEELCHAALASRDPRPLETRLSGAAWLNALIESRVARLPATHAEVVRAAALIGNDVPLWLLEKITTTRLNERLILDLAEQDVLFPSDQRDALRFKHGITRDVIYAALGRPERRAGHRAIAAAIRAHANSRATEQGESTLAHHYAAGDMPLEAAACAETAGDRALAALALDRARVQYHAALSALDSVTPLTPAARSQWCAIAEKLGIACVFDPLAMPHGIALFERALALAQATQDRNVIARAHYWLGYFCYAKGRAPQAIVHCEQAIAIAEKINDPRLVVQVRAVQAQALASAGQYDTALQLFDQVLDSKRKQSKPGSGVAVGSAYSLACKGAAMGDQGLFVAAHECFDAALVLLGDSPHQVASSVRSWIAAVYLWQGRWSDAYDMAESSVRVAANGKNRQLLAMSSALRGYADWMRNADTGALQAVRTGTTWIEERNGLFLTSLNYGWLVDGTASQGNWAEMRRHAARLFLRARQLDRIGEAMGCRALALAASGGGAFDTASRYLQKAQTSATARASQHEAACNALCEARVLLAQEKLPAAARCLDQAQATFDRLGMAWHGDQARAVRAILER